MDFQCTVQNGDVSLNVAIQGEAPSILCVHGWPKFGTLVKEIELSFCAGL